MCMCKVEIQRPSVIGPGSVITDRVYQPDVNQLITPPA